MQSQSLGSKQQTKSLSKGKTGKTVYRAKIVKRLLLSQFWLKVGDDEPLID